MIKFRDSQRQRVYAAEHKIRRSTYNTALNSKQEIIQFVNEVYNSAWMKNLSKSDFNTGEQSNCLNVIKHAPRIRFNAGRDVTASAYPTLNELRLPANNRWSWNKQVIIHEITHLLVTRGGAHGEQFVTIQLSLVKEFIGQELHDQMVGSYIEESVKGPFVYRPKKRSTKLVFTAQPKPVVTPVIQAASPKKISRKHRYPLHVAIVRKIGKFLSKVGGGV